MEKIMGMRWAELRPVDGSSIDQNKWIEVSKMFHIIPDRVQDNWYQFLGNDGENIAIRYENLKVYVLYTDKHPVISGDVIHLALALEAEIVLDQKII